MSDLISRQAAIDALEREKTYCTAYKEGYTKTDVFQKYNMGLTDGIKALNKLPPVDAVPVVRCKDCRFYRFYDGTFGKGWMCFENNTARHGDDYCSRGERKDV